MAYKLKHKNMTEQEKVRNDLLIDSVEIQEETRKLNFNMVAFVTCWALIEMFPINLSLTYVGQIITLIFVVAVTLICVGYGLAVFLGMLKLDFVFYGQFIRDTESVANWIVNLKKSKND